MNRNERVNIDIEIENSFSGKTEFATFRAHYGDAAEWLEENRPNGSVASTNEHGEVTEVFIRGARAIQRFAEKAANSGFEVR